MSRRSQHVSSLPEVEREELLAELGAARRLAVRFGGRPGGPNYDVLHAVVEAIDAVAAHLAGDAQYFWAKRTSVPPQGGC
ncbi:hypothetical protein [Bradyrhizobium sp. WD16]|uniref:hypothetical protein n=1 Tax=Bradyrhizobium sp. WD16 TaxID=1521768 RepID=UPI0020A3C632|nr:hypothetical protein [Bradyrhizobium sp. WD16]UTD28641.1 hypothetical protein DB459_18790 [Bradyrhizobium sp. WD16]